MAAGTRVGRSSGAGTRVTPGNQGSVYAQLLWVSGLVADALVAPVTVPTADTMLLQHDATGVKTLWVYIVSLGTWDAVQLGGA